MLGVYYFYIVSGYEFCFKCITINPQHSFKNSLVLFCEISIHQRFWAERPGVDGERWRGGWVNCNPMRGAIIITIIIRAGQAAVPMTSSCLFTVFWEDNEAFSLVINPLPASGIRAEHCRCAGQNFSVQLRSSSIWISLLPGAKFRPHVLSDWMFFLFYPYLTTKASFRLHISLAELWYSKCILGWVPNL